MLVAGKPFRTLWVAEDGESVDIIDQTRLPTALVVARLTSVASVAKAIRTMQVRGAPLIGIAGAYGICLAMRTDSSDDSLRDAYVQLLATRPTAVNLRWALDRMVAGLQSQLPQHRAERAYAMAAELADDDVETCRRIGVHGATMLQTLWQTKQSSEPLQVLTHCNAGWLATIDWGTALAPIYVAHDQGVPIHVWVDETRPRNQGYLTAWELGQHGVGNTVIVDNAGGLLMRQGKVDVCIVGTDRTAPNGDVANKIGTYLKALAARDNDIPFYAAVPASSIDWTLESGAGIPIEERDVSEVHSLAGIAAHNPGFDVTPARLITGLITERGICAASVSGIGALYPEHVGN